MGLTNLGGQPTLGFRIDFELLAKSLGYKNSHSVNSIGALKDVMPKFLESTGPSLLEVKVNMGSRADLGRPKETPQSSKTRFMENLNV